MKAERRVGIPCAMYHHYLYPYVKTFFQEIGLQPVLSGPTNRNIMEDGLRAAVDEACLPVKVYYGHVLELEKQRLDYLFIPRLVALEPRTYLCPKLMGIPDMVKAELELKTPVIDPLVDLSRGDLGFRRELHRWGSRLGAGRLALIRAGERAVKSQRQVRDLAARRQLTYPEAFTCWEQGGIAEENPGNITVGVLGHGYITHDPQISMDLIPSLRRMAVRVITPEMLDQQEIERWAATLPKRIFWSIGRITVGAALALQAAGVDGLIHTACFGCGPDSLIGEIVERKTRDVPLLKLTLDEHTGRAGLQTRLEAFCDMLERKKKRAGYLPSSGQCLYSITQSVYPDEHRGGGTASLFPPHPGIGDPLLP